MAEVAPILKNAERQKPEFMWGSGTLVTCYNPSISAERLSLFVKENFKFFALWRICAVSFRHR